MLTMAPNNTPAKLHKAFDSLAFKKQSQEQIYEETSHMTPQELIDYFHQHSSTGTLGQWWQSVVSVTQPSLSVDNAATQVKELPAWKPNIVVDSCRLEDNDIC